MTILIISSASAGRSTVSVVPRPGADVDGEGSAELVNALTGGVQAEGVGPPGYRMLSGRTCWVEALAVVGDGESQAAVVAVRVMVAVAAWACWMTFAIAPWAMRRSAVCRCMGR